MGYIYLLQPAELVGTDRYKIGISSKDNLNRLKSYGGGTRYIFFMECDNYLFVENKLKESFNKNKLLICIKGKEYFKGPEEIIMKEFFSIVFKYNIKHHVDNNEIKESILSDTDSMEVDLMYFSDGEKYESSNFEKKINKFKYSLL